MSKAFAAHLVAGDPPQAGTRTVPRICHTWQDFAAVTGDEDRLLLLLFHVEPDRTARAQGLPARDPGGIRGTLPEVWRLFYLVAASSIDAMRAQDVLAQAAVRLSRNPVIDDANAGGGRHLVTELQAVSQDGMVSIWTGLHQPLRPSLVCCVRVEDDQVA